jgi:hypothetical protein
LDIQKAYHHIPVAAEFQPYLAFQYGGQYYQYIGMPFGVKHAPRIFTRVMHAAMVEIREQWNVTSVQYLDDLLFLDSDAVQLQRKIEEIARFLQQLGWSINWEKSNMLPSKRFVYLGVEWDTEMMQLRIEQKRNEALKRQVRLWMRIARKGRRVRVRLLAALIGRLSQTRIQHSRASLYLSKMNRMKTQAVLSAGWNGYVQVKPSILSELLWWSTQLRQNQPAPIRYEGLTATVCTDASLQGWGG